MNQPKRLSFRGGVCVIAGEASGDAQAALVIEALAALSTEKSLFFWGIAGPLMRKAGVQSVIDTEELSVMGFSEIFKHYLRISSLYKKILFEIIRRKPYLIIVVDYPGFNLRLAEDVTRLGFKVAYYIVPKVWAHGYARIEKLKKYTTLLLSILPFEERFFRECDLNAIFVGNPLFDAVNRYIQNRFDIQKQLDEKCAYDHKYKFTIGILPGSRKAEIERIFPVMIEAFVKLSSDFPNIVGKVPIAQTLSSSFVYDIFEKTCKNLHVDPKKLKRNFYFFEGQTYDVMYESHYAWVCSGTATLETAFFQTPLCAVYKLSSITVWIARLLLKVKYVSLVNLCMNKEVIPEFLQESATAENLVFHAKEMLTNQSKRKSMILELSHLRNLFPRDAPESAAHIISDLIKKSEEWQSI